jgi:hypothetical protein
LRRDTGITQRNYGEVTAPKKFLVAVTGGECRNSTIEEALHVAEVISAASSAENGAWQRVPAVPGATFGHRTGD